MNIERSNILELIGTGKNKYHSCVITSYSIDLAFFEQLILPRLRGAGITNINLFVDASMLEKYLASHLGDSLKKFNANYSITPVSISGGAFHPKMLFLAGKDKGYLSIGSGNITSSGLLYNDEIWSSFFTSKERLDAQPIFKSAWQYIQSLSSHSLGINVTKINWIAQHSQWISDLKNHQDSSTFIKDVEYSMFYTQSSKSLYSEVISTLSRKPKSIKIIAPYYNRSGAFLQKLIDDLAPEEIHCVVDTSNGILPVDFTSSICQFSDWKDVINNENSKSIQRLHAKIIQIEYNEETVFILGSANATLEAYGISNRAFKNDEAVVILSIKKPKDFIKELGIQIPKNGSLDIKNIINAESENQEITEGLLKIKHVELSDGVVQVSLDKEFNSKCVLKTFDSNNGLLENIDVTVNSKTIQTPLKVTESIFKIALYDASSQERISTFGLVQNVNALKKSNPDERLARLQSFEHLDIFSSLNYELVLDFLDQEQVFKDSSTSQAPLLVSNENVEDEGEVISENEYNKNASLSLDERVTSDNITSMVEEFLDVLKIRENPEELSDNAEELATEAGDDGMDEEISLKHTQSFINASEGQRIARKIEKTIKAVTTLIDSRRINKVSQDTKSLNALFVGFHILLHFWDEVYVEELSQVKVHYKQLDELHKLERKFGLKRLESQINSSNYEVSYYVDYALLNTFILFVENSNKAFKLVDTPSEPITFRHSIISNKYIQDYTSKNWLLDFIDLGLSQIMISLKSSEFTVDEAQKLKLIILSNQLINKLVWNNKFSYWKELVLLNVYNTFNLSSLHIEHKDLPDKLLDWSFCNDYLKFEKGLIEASIKGTEVNAQLVNSIVYSKVMGFGMIRKVLKDAKLEFYSPILNRDLKEDDGGVYKEVYISKKVKIF
ncbi:hypothetical protein JCM19296_1223 [Nonlabens ulvanivorans]|uniref:PLD phosphodiesterase domain-containing protein n=1 Tax=Nonlabens ulvanivorans TaxID=906888 RepID=A0A081D9N5_NONUL|nr:hypothetical protein [Nonlabens ulvanivorans]GAK75631.1 hypothetical protein JCM19296_1223 [Nonlabens ulvanivorans]